MRSYSHLGLLLIAASSVFAQTSDYEWKGAIARGRLLEIRGINGDIHALPSSGTEVEVVAKVHSEGGVTTENVKIHMDAADGNLTVCATRRGESLCQPAGAPGAAGPGARVDFYVRVPNGVHFKGRTVNGGVRASLLAGDIEAYTVNGAVDVATNGSATVHTVNGSITAAIGGGTWRKKPEFSAVNGEIVLRLPSSVSTKLSAETQNGTIQSDFRGLRGQVTEKKVQARLGAGKADTVTIRTVNGSIQLKKSS